MVLLGGHAAGEGCESGVSAGCGKGGAQQHYEEVVDYDALRAMARCVGFEVVQLDEDAGAPHSRDLPLLFRRLRPPKCTITLLPH